MILQPDHEKGNTGWIISCQLGGYSLPDSPGCSILMAADIHSMFWASIRVSGSHPMNSGGTELGEEREMQAMQVAYLASQELRQDDIREILQIRPHSG
jgi:hypothetical protein